MADFLQALAITGINEGGISNSPLDRGSFTYAGIASKYWPNWQGWPLVKQALTNCNGDFGMANRQLRENAIVQNFIQDFYKQNFWDALKLDQINDQQLAQSVYDCSVNCGIGTAGKMLQHCVGIAADGIVGPHTIQFVNGTDGENLYNIFNASRKAYYEDIIARDPSQKVFEHSWLSRLKPYVK